MSDFYGKGIIKGLGVSLKQFIETYLDDIAWLGKRYRTDEGIAHRGSKDARVVFLPSNILRKKYRYLKSSVLSHSLSMMKVRMGKRICDVPHAAFAQRFARLNASGSSGLATKQPEGQYRIRPSFSSMQTFA